jgi:hypothetical protein
MAVLLPSSLVMRSAECFYCENEYDNDETTFGRIGIRYCSTHKTAAKRDSNAYLHQQKRVKLRDALRHPVLGPFLSQCRTNTYIRRSNGEVQGQWILQEEEYDDSKLILWEEGVWYIPMMHPGIHVRKTVALDTFEDTRIASLNPPALGLQVPAIRALLDEGVYKADYEAHLAAGPAIVRPETAGVQYCIADGQLVRVFHPPSSTA